jgi:hypothetical protein
MIRRQGTLLAVLVAAALLSAGCRDRSMARSLQGRWTRPDGGYVLEIKRVAADGKLDAAYFNPRPIHVAEARAFREGSTIKVTVELRDENYPGSTYNLRYDPQSDRLSGDYYQAVARQHYPIFFVRMK